MLVQTDVTRAHEVEALIERVVATWGRVDRAFKQRGHAGEMARSADCTEENHRTISVNLSAVLYSQSRRCSVLVGSMGVICDVVLGFSRRALTRASAAAGPTPPCSSR
jgi:NAD(P)-dependent dehydrogenase (short-subunit alcohol dehydrogenase family)